MKTLWGTGLFCLVLAACGGEHAVRLTMEEQKKLASPGIRVTAIVDEASPIVLRLLAASEAEILASGRPLDEEELASARAIGVQAPERVRVAIREQFPLPDDARLVSAASDLGLPIGTAAETGRTQGYAILLKPSVADSRAALAHELAHVAQCERLGGLRPYVHRYLIEVLAIGYAHAPLEQEAKAAEFGSNK
jgi:hypothetical protein